MKKIVLLVALALTGLLTWYLFQTKPKPDNEVAAAMATPEAYPKTAKDSFIYQSLDRYYALAERLVNWDSAAVQDEAKALQRSLATLEKDSTNMKLTTAAAAITQQPKLEGKRRAFDAFSQNFYTWLRQNNYRGSAVYLQECPMAFNDTETARWLSKTEIIRNPYLGMHHPKYKSGMLACGEVKDSIAYK